MVLIIGGGISGLGIGWYLARAGCPVTVLERDEAGHGATWAAAGMLAPHVEAEPTEEKLLPLQLASHAAWAGFARELEEASGIAVDYRTEGTLVVALNRDDVERLRFQYNFQRQLGLPVEWWYGDQLRELEPHLARGVVAGIFSALDHQVDNRKAALALRAAFLRAGGVLREHTPVAEIIIEDNRAQGVRTAEGRLLAETVVLAAGAWSRGIGGLPDSVRPPVRPVKGQMLAAQMPPHSPLIQHVVWGQDVYLVPRLDGRLLIGATVEEQGFDTQLTAGGVMRLLQGARDILPEVCNLPLIELWAGLRPGSRDDAPILGLTEIQGLILATGHHRNGILLAPITAQSISHLILTGEVMEEIKPFNVERFKK